MAGKKYFTLRGNVKNGIVLFARLSLAFRVLEDITTAQRAITLLLLEIPHPKVNRKYVCILDVLTKQEKQTSGALHHPFAQHRYAT